MIARMGGSCQFSRIQHWPISKGGFCDRKKAGVVVARPTHFVTSLAGILGPFPLAWRVTKPAPKRAESGVFEGRWAGKRNGDRVTKWGQDRHIPHRVMQVS